METRLRIRPPHILLNTTEQYGYLINKMGMGSKWDGTFKAFKIPFCPEMLIKIKQFYPNPKVIEGQEYIDRMKDRLRNIETGKKKAGEILPVVVNNSEYKPYEHQLRSLTYLINFDGAALFAQCGTGKTAMCLWDIQLKYEQKLISPSSVLVVGKLMTMFSGWHESTGKCTGLNSKVLWQPGRSRLEKGEKIVVGDHGPKPPGKGRTYTKTEYFFKTGEPAIIAGPRHFNPRKHVVKQRAWKQVGDKKYGKETLTDVTRINVRSENIGGDILDKSCDIHIINHEGLITFEKELIERRYEYIVFDESTAIKNPQSKTFKALMKIAANAKYRRILSGTPSPQGPQDLWGQFYFLDEGLTLGPSYKQFLNEHFNIVSLGSVAAGTYSGTKICLRPDKPGQEGTLSYINRMLDNRIFRCRLRDCVDLPPLTSKIVDVYLTDEQQKHYETMKEAFFAEIDGEKIDVTVDIAKLMKLRQITGGFIINREGEVKKICKTNPKLDALKSLIEEIGHEEKIVIFAVYRCEIEMLLSEFGKSAVAIYGGVSDKNKLAAQEKFKKDKKVKYIICQPRSAAYGIDGLQALSSNLIFYSMDYSADTYRQAIHRIERTGQKNKMFAYHLLAWRTIDHVIYSVVGNKEETQQKTIDIDIIKKLKETQP